MNLEQKVEVLDGELGLLKGEIKQTLVDLREFIMKQGAPFPVEGQHPLAGESPELAGDGQEAPEGPPGVQQVSAQADEGGPGLSENDMQRMLDEARASGREQAEAEIRGEQPSQPTGSQPQVQVVQAPPGVEPQVQVMDSGESPIEVPVLGPEIATPPVDGEVPEAPPAYPEPGVAAGPADWGTAAGVPPVSGAVPGVGGLDTNLLASLVRWVGSVKRRLGAGQLEGFLEMYKLTGHLPPVVERLIFYLAALEALPDESSDQVFTLDDLMDSLMQLRSLYQHRAVGWHSS